MTKKSWITISFHQVQTQPALTNCCWACFLINVVFRPLWEQPLGNACLDASLGMHSLLTMQLHSGREIAPNIGANATNFHFGDQILKISRQIGD